MEVQRKVLVTGAGGYVGTHLCKALQHNSAFNILALLRNPSKQASEGFPSEIDIIKADVLNYKAIDTIVKNVDYVVHLVTGSTESIVAGTNNIAKACHKYSRPLIHLSSAAIYGIVADQKHLSNSTPDRFTGNPYSDAKILAERILQQYGERGLKFVGLRPRVIWGPNSFWVKQFFNRVNPGEEFPLINGGDGACNTIFIGNLVGMIEALLVSGVQNNGFYYITDAAQLTWKDFYQNLGLIEGGNIKFSYVTDTITQPTLAGKVDFIYKMELYLSFHPRLLSAFKLLKRAIKKISRSILSSSKTAQNQTYFGSTLRYSREVGCTYTDISEVTDKLGYVPFFTIEDGMAQIKAWKESEQDK